MYLNKKSKKRRSNVQKNGFDVYYAAMEFMRKNLFAKLKMEDVAVHCHISPSGLEKIFARYGHGSVMRSFLDMKLYYAAKKLEEGYTVKHMAEVLNFSSLAHFSAAFKQKHGVSPQKYKLEHINKPMA